LKMATEAKSQQSESYAGVVLVLPRGFKRPKGFPRGKLLSEEQRGRVYSFDPDKIIKWINQTKVG